MSEALRILVLEDMPADVVMINHELRTAGMAFRCKRVETKRDFLYELEHNQPDIILSDHGLPSFDGFAALALAKKKCPDVPFIFVTGSVGEETAVQTLKCGATDYVVKSRLSTHLVQAIRRALSEVEERSKRRRAEQALQSSEEQFRLLVEGVRDYALCMLDPEGRVVNWNSGAEAILGYTADAITGHHYSCFFTDQDAAHGKPEFALNVARTEGRFEEEGWRQRRGGVRFIANVVINALRDKAGNLRGFTHVTRDVTGPNHTKEALAASSKVQYSHLAALFPDPLLLQAENEIVFANEAAAELLSTDDAEHLVGKPLQGIIRADDWERFHIHMRRVQDEGMTFVAKSARKSRKETVPRTLSGVHLVRLDGKPVKVDLTGAPVTIQDQSGVMVLVHDIESS